MKRVIYNHLYICRLWSIVTYLRSNQSFFYFFFRVRVNEGSPHVAMAQQGAEATYLVIAERLVSNPRREPSISNDPVRQARSEATSLASGNRRLPNNDAWWQC
jgi:hypothetical protein